MPVVSFVANFAAFKVYLSFSPHDIKLNKSIHIHRTIIDTQHRTLTSVEIAIFTILHLEVKVHESSCRKRMDNRNYGNYGSRHSA